MEVLEISVAAHRALRARLFLAVGYLSGEQQFGNPMIDLGALLLLAQSRCRAFGSFRGDCGRTLVSVDKWLLLSV